MVWRILVGIFVTLVILALQTPTVNSININRYILSVRWKNTEDSRGKYSPLMFRKRNTGLPADCRGRYDPSMIIKLENVCDDCYNLYKEPDVHQLCRSGDSSEYQYLDSSGPNSFVDLMCPGHYDRQLLNQRNQVCQDCFNLFREPGIFSSCRSNCFFNKTYQDCLKRLTLLEESNSVL